MQRTTAAQPPPEKETHIRHVNEDAAYVEARRKQGQFGAKAQEIREWLGELWQQISIAASTLSGPRPADPLDAAADALFRGEPLSTVAEELELMRKRGQAMQQSLEILERAAQKAREMAEQRLNEVAVEIAAQFALEAMELERGALLALVALGRAEEAKGKFAARVPAESGLPTINGSPMSFLGGLNISTAFAGANPLEPEARIIYRLRAAIAVGVLDASEVPGHWLNPPGPTPDPQVRTVKLVVAYGINQAGDVCGLPAARAEMLIRNRWGVAVDAAGKPGTLASLLPQRTGRRVVRLLKNFKNNVAGDVCGFDVETAEQLIGTGAAEPYTS